MTNFLRHAWSSQDRLVHTNPGLTRRQSELALTYSREGWSVQSRASCCEETCSGCLIRKYNVDWMGLMIAEAWLQTPGAMLVSSASCRFAAMPWHSGIWKSPPFSSNKCSSKAPQNLQVYGPAWPTFWTRRRMANSAQAVLPLPVGAATRQLSSVLYRAVKTCRADRKRLRQGSGQALLHDKIRV